MKPSVGSLFSGIGGFDLGLERAGWSVKWQVENDPYCNKILSRHWPEAARYGDITGVDTDSLERVDLICGGFPCQDLSVAGTRKGLAGERSALFFQVVRIADALRPRWLLVENVPGLLSSNDGRDFGVVVGELAQLGYGLQWRVLDSQHFGVPQRRRRVFIVGHLGAPCPPEVLFEPESLPRHPAPGSGERPRVAGALAAGAHPSGFNGQDAYDPVVAVRLAQTSGNGWGVTEDGTTHTLDGIGGDAIAFRKRTMAHGKDAQDETRERSKRANVLTVDQRPTTVIGTPADPSRVRVTPGISDWLDPDEPDSPRYRALGNAVTVPVIEWIGHRLINVFD